MEFIKKLSNSIDRKDFNVLSSKCVYNYEFSSRQFLENIDDYGYFGINHDSIKELVIESLLKDFKLELEKIIFPKTF